MNRDLEGSAPLAVEAIGWLAFLLFVVGVWRLRQTLDRWRREP